MDLIGSVGGALIGVIAIGGWVAVAVIVSGARRSEPKDLGRSHSDADANQIPPFAVRPPR